MSKVISIHDAAIPGEPYAPTIEMLRDMLDKAERGEITACAVTAIAEHDRDCLVYANFPAGRRFQLGYAVAQLFTDFMTQDRKECGL